jgi:hypothetical protein
MIDYSESLERLEKALGGQYAVSPHILGTPGTSLACKVDPFHYLAIQPGFIKYLSRFAGMFQEKVLATLVKTGSMLTAGPGHEVHQVSLRVFEEGGSRIVPVTASFLPASFVDRALALHAGLESPPPVSRLRILLDDRPLTLPLFAGKTPLADVAFGNPNRT